MNPQLFDGLEAILQGIISPIVISFCATIVRIALFGWYGVKHFAANLTVGIFGGVLAHWVLTRFDFDPTIDAAIVACCSLLSRDALAAFFSKKSLTKIGEAMGNRVCHEILHRGAPRKERDHE